MSYSFSVPACSKEDLAEQVATAWSKEAERITAYGTQPIDEITEQVVGAFAGVQAMAANIGRVEDHVVVAISGHANPGHAPTDGYANECCTVSINVVHPQPQPE